MKRITSIILTVLVILALFTACAKDPGTTALGFIGFPCESYIDRNGEYCDHCHPINAQCSADVNNAAAAAYREPMDYARDAAAEKKAEQV